LERNIHHCPREKHIGGGVKSFDACTRRMELFHARVVIPIKRTEETTIIGERRINGGRQSIGIEPVGVRFIILLCPLIVDQKRIGCRRATNGNTVHSVGLGMRACHRPVSIMMKVTD
jgi:hypothetical protein